MNTKTPTFELHPRLQADTTLLATMPLSRVLLMEDARYPWCILVPERMDIREIFELEDSEQQQLLRESSLLGAAMMRAYRGDKLNIGALGNLVPQLHLHHIVRNRSDDAWPGPVWGRHPPIPYTDSQRDERIDSLRVHLTGATWHR